MIASSLTSGHGASIRSPMRSTKPSSCQSAVVMCGRSGRACAAGSRHIRREPPDRRASRPLKPSIVLNIFMQAETTVLYCMRLKSYSAWRSVVWTSAAQGLGVVRKHLAFKGTCTCDEVLLRECPVPDAAQEAVGAFGAGVGPGGGLIGSDQRTSRSCGPCRRRIFLMISRGSTTLFFDLDIFSMPPRVTG